MRSHVARYRGSHLSQRRSSSSSGRRALVAAGLAAALVTVPGTAAATEADPVEEVTSFLEGLATEAPAAQALPGLPPFTVPPAVLDAFRQLADAAMLPESCVDGVAEAIELIVNGIIALPLELAGALADLLELLGGGIPGGEGLEPLQDLLEQLLGGLTGGLPGGLPGALPGGLPGTAAVAAGDATAVDAPAEGVPEADPLEADVPEEGEVPGGPDLPTLTLVDGLLALGAALQGCIPAPPAGEEPEKPEPTTPPVSHPTPEAPKPAPAPVAQPVSYPGYAPTGADTARADDASVPLTALAGGLVLVAGAGAAGYGMRGRAGRARD